MLHYGAMKAYSEDLRKSRRGRSLSPGKAPGKRPAIDGRARRLLEEDIRERPFLTLQDRCEYLRAVTSVEVSRSAMCRAIGRMNSTRKKGGDPLQNATSS